MQSLPPYVEKQKPIKTAAKKDMLYIPISSEMKNEEHPKHLQWRDDDLDAIKHGQSLGAQNASSEFTSTLKQKIKNESAPKDHKQLNSEVLQEKTPSSGTSNNQFTIRRHSEGSPYLVDLAEQARRNGNKTLEDLLREVITPEVLAATAELEKYPDGKLETNQEMFERFGKPTIEQLAVLFTAQEKTDDRCVLYALQARESKITKDPDRFKRIQAAIDDLDNANKSNDSIS